MDIDDIDPGEDFVEAINLKLESCAVVVALIGKNWLTCVDSTGARRLEKPDDYVRRELSRALVRKIRVIPVLVGNASMPLSSSLPAELAPLAYRNALEISDTRFHQDVDRLVQVLRKVLTPGAGKRTPETENKVPLPPTFAGSRNLRQQEQAHTESRRVSERPSPSVPNESPDQITPIPSPNDRASEDHTRRVRARIKIAAIVATLLLIPLGFIVKTKLGTITVPNVVGRPIEEARHIIATAGLAVGKETLLEEDNVAAGTVLKQSPQPGEVGPRRSNVDLVMATAAHVAVPSLVGKSVEEGKRLLLQQGLVVGNTELKVSPGSVAGIILRQHPEAGAPAAKGDAVNLDVAARPSLVLADVRGDTLSRAKTALFSAGLVVGTVEYRKTAEAEPGTILEQQPKPGENVEPGAQILLVVASSPEVEIPNLAKMTLANARTALEHLGLKLGTVKTAGFTTSTEIVEPTVRSQVPAAGVRLRHGTPVDIVVAEPGVRIPEVAKMLLKDARITLERAGLTVGNVTEKHGVAVEPGRVMETHGAGGWVARGSRVDLVVASKTPLLQVSTSRRGELRFDPRPIGDWETQPVNLQNQIKGELERLAPTIRSLIITGDHSTDFKMTSATSRETPCPGTPFKLDRDCTVRVIFTPVGAGARTASLTIVSDSEGSPHRISLSGTGIAGRKERKKPDRQSGAGAEADGYFRQAQATGNFAEALPLFRRAAELGHAEAQYLVGSAYARGSKIVPRDDGLALHWFRLAAQQGHAKAQSSLAQMYQEGRGVGTDYAEAMKWYRTAAAAGDVGGQYGMALMYSNGQGVPKDEGIAVMWFRKAAAQGHFRAQEELKKRGLGW